MKKEETVRLLQFERRTQRRSKAESQPSSGSDMMMESIINGRRRRRPEGRSWSKSNGEGERWRLQSGVVGYIIPALIVAVLSLCTHQCAADKTSLSVKNRFNEVEKSLRSLQVNNSGLITIETNSSVQSNSTSDNNSTSTTPSITVVTAFVLSSECSEPIIESDSNSDGGITREEFIGLANRLEGNDLFSKTLNNGGGDPSDYIPLLLAFNYLSCLCRDFGGEDDCCTSGSPHIYTDPPQGNKAFYYSQVCAVILDAIVDVKEGGYVPSPPTPDPTSKPTTPPTLNPVGTPTVPPTANPTKPPTPFPTDSPTSTPIKPTSFPSSYPSKDGDTPHPTASPTTVAPTSRPTLSPTSRPTLSPTAPPTLSPTTSSPTTLPTTLPPTQTDPTPPPTSSPTTLSPTTLNPTTSAPIPVLFNDQLNISFSFSIANNVDMDARAILTSEEGPGYEMRRDMIVAAGKLAETLVGELYGTGTSQSQARFGGRGLIVLYLEETPATIDDIVDVAGCPEYTNPSNVTLCANVYATIAVYRQDDPARDPPIQVGFRSALLSAVGNNGLSDYLPAETFISYTGSMLPDSQGGKLQPTNSPGIGISSGIAPAGGGGDDGVDMALIITIVGVLCGVIVLAGAGFFVVRRRKYRDGRDHDFDPELYDIQDTEGHRYPDEKEMSAQPTHNRTGSSSSAGRLGASNPHYGSSRSNRLKVKSFASFGDDASGSGSGSRSGGIGYGVTADGLEPPSAIQHPTPTASITSSATPVTAVTSSASSPASGNLLTPASPMDLWGNESISSGMSSSNAGSSGWSSSAGISSLNTGSESSSIDYDRALAGGSTLAAIGAASAAAHKYGNRSDNPKFVPITSGMDTSTLGSDTSDQLMDDYNATSIHNINGDAVPQLPTVSRADLDSAIEAGDWAAVGATAALLASATGTDSDTRSFSSARSGSLRSKSSVSSLDAQRAAELDHLVDAGDWEGVVKAAARFEAQSDSRSAGDSHAFSSDGLGLGSLSRGSKSKDPSGNGSVATSHSPSVATTGSESISKAQKRAEIRSEVEALVRRVVPDEIDNIDEMMHQFHGREEELVETLRTMQERSIAQRARAAVHKSAKREAKLMVRGARNQQSMSGPKGLPRPLPPSGPSQGPAAGTAVTAGSIVHYSGSIRGLPPRQESQSTNMSSLTDLNQDSKSNMFPSAFGNTAPSSGDAPSTGAPSVNTASLGSLMSSEEGSKGKLPFQTSTSGSKGGTALELAIEAGDWAAVGEAAAMMSDHASVSTRGSSLGSEYQTGSEFGSMGSRRGSKGGAVNANRAAELDKMIDRGDWSGVVAAASRYSAADAVNTKQMGRRQHKRDGSKESVGSAKKQRQFSGENASQGSKEDSNGSNGSKRWIGRMFGNAKKNTTSKDTTSTGDGTNPNNAMALQEEQDALAQAEIWMAIAEQSRKDDQANAEVTKGASEAADWAISRSLSALRSAERKGELQVIGGTGMSVENRKPPLRSNDSVGSSKGDKSV